LGLVIAALAIAGCDFFGDDATNAVRDRLDRARQKWENQDIQNYEFRYSQQRGETIVDTARVFVQSGEVDSIATTPQVDEEELLVQTVQSFFDLIEARIDDDNPYGARFDQELGYPTEYNANYQGDRRDEDIITLALVESDSTGS